MSSLKSMPVGYRFHPTDQELINHYLKLKNQGADRYVSNIREIDVLKWEPRDIPGHLGSESDDQEWYFFGRRDSKYGKSTRANRATKEGYWKPTGKDRNIEVGSKKVIGTKKTLVFYRGRNKKGIRTYWVMHEYRASADIHNPQAFVLYRLKKKTDESVKIPNTDGAELNVSSPSASLLNNVPSHSPSTPIVHQGSAHFSSSDQSRLTQNWKEQEVSSHAQKYPAESVFGEDDDIDLQALKEFFDGQGQPLSWEGLDRMFSPIHTTARLLNVSNNDPGMTQFHNIKRQEEVVNSINSATSRCLRTPDNVTFTSESGTETDNDVPQSLFGEDAVHGRPAYLSDAESSDEEFYNDMILAHEVSLSGKSDVIQRRHLKADKEDCTKLVFSGVSASAVSNQRAKTYSEVPAQASGKKEYGNPPSNKSTSKSLEADSDGSSAESLLEAKSIKHLELARNKSSSALGKSSDKMGFIVYAENPRVSNGTTPPSNYILNIAIGIFLTVVITGEVMFGLVS